MEVSEIETAKSGTHSFRRGADRRARAWCIKNGISLDSVDKTLGWKEAEHSRDMQLHYDEDTLSRRWEEAQVTFDVLASSSRWRGLFGCCAAEAVCNYAASIRFGRACVCHRWGAEGVSKAGTASPPGHGLPYDMLLM